MKNYIAVIPLGIFSFCFTANAEIPNWSFPDPKEYALHLVELCKPESTSAIFIAMLRDKGLTKEQVTAHLPQGTLNHLRLTQVVQENLNDLFEYPNVAALSYYAFRAQSCANEKGEGKAAIHFSSIANDVITCQNTYSIENRPALAACIRTLMK
ncbi:hypothetical protein [Acinetobacter courvalinii]|uniref:Uncharacterized protein n=1 Tax=Acinetobacter courvalinii TaxID=280147 RepID=N9RBH5_9GAMM|nr:hypothetical protein [Acinetobacter courvalinii]ENX39726.1 hypothetical protein F888_01212 [Acinetobacter courvalinii]KAB0659726.1 hypothetical protein F7P77_06105 [Acinetobacter courvalinii]RSN80364.1 hypothetical protein EA770_14790 [Acinetobacter baumannii]GGH41009.1 hypothetical protein GCM10007354_27950 [Acinetobacter courvalinii]